MKGFMVLLASLSLALVLTGCSKDTKVVLTVKYVTEAGVEAASSLKFNLLPYDGKAVKDSLELANNPPEEPSREQLLVLRGEYESVNGEYNNHLEEYRLAESEVKKVKDIRSKTYEKAYKRYTDAKAKNKELNEKREEARSKYIEIKKAYDKGFENWQNIAYEGLDEVVSRIREERGITEDYLIKTDKEGVGRVVVPGGEWWLNSKERHPDKRYTWLIWNVPITTTGGELAVELTQDNAEEWTE
jgi:hypothetical protein